MIDGLTILFGIGIIALLIVLFYIKKYEKKHKHS